MEAAEIEFHQKESHRNDTKEIRKNEYESYNFPKE
jgi:hypothetical protein